MTASTPTQMVYVVTDRVGAPYAAFANYDDAIASCERRGVGYVIPMVIA